MAEPLPILCVEDNDANFALVKLVLEKTGRWDVSRAANVEEARASLASSLPAAVLLDLDLPQISGLVLAREMKGSDRTRAIPIIVLSASVMRQEHAKAREAGCEFFIEKPFDIGALRKTVDRAVASRAG